MKTPCKVQCPQCPFRSDSLPGWLGSYTPETIPPTLWRNAAFLCHSKVDYDAPGWRAKAERSGKLCRGALVFANRMMAPKRIGAYPGEEDTEVLTAREQVGNDPKVDCMAVRDFVAYHQTAAKERHTLMTTRRAAAIAAGYRDPSTAITP